MADSTPLPHEHTHLLFGSGTARTREGKILLSSTMLSHYLAKRTS